MSLLGEVHKGWPLRLDLIRWLSETATLVATLVKTKISSLIGALGLLLPLLPFPGHLWASHRTAHRSLVLLVLSGELALMHARALHVFVTTTIVTLLVISRLFLLYHTKFRVLNSGN